MSNASKKEQGLWLATHRDEIAEKRRKAFGDAPIGYAFIEPDALELKPELFIAITDPDEVAWVTRTWDPVSPVSGPGGGRVCVIACLQ